MVDFRIAVRAFIVNSGRLLVLKRESKDVQMPGIWEPPGGRLEPGEDPFEGLKREVMEETGLEVNVKEPMTVRHFTRQDGQIITMLTFLCSSKGREVKISEEHIEFKWVDLGEDIHEFLGSDGFYWKEVESYRRMIRD